MTMAKRGTASKAEKEHMSRVVALGCIVCHNIGVMDCPAEIHHIRSGMGMGQRNDHFSTIPLCHTHHRTGQAGIAFHAGSKTWQERYGTEEELLEQVKSMLMFSTNTSR